MEHRTENHFCGLLVVNKESGFTSNDVVAKLRGILHMRKIGHTGTLDPIAEGVLPVCLGNATKIADLVAERDKEYVAMLRLGRMTDTQDRTGKILKECSFGEISLETIEKAAEKFTGEIEQIPPMYSAIWSNGRRLYDLAREGVTVERKPRHIVIHEIEIQSMDLPFVTLRVVCSKGTYIRTLCEDLGNALGCGGCMESLLRTRVGNFTLDGALTLSEIQHMMEEDPAGKKLEAHVQAPDAFFTEAPCVHVKKKDVAYLRNGNALSATNTVEGMLPKAQRIRVYDEEGAFYALYRYDKNRRRILPFKMLCDTDSRAHDR